MVETKEDNTTGKQASPNKINQVAKPSDNSQIKGIPKPMPNRPGLDLANIPKKLRLGGKVNGESGFPNIKKPTAETKIKVETADVAPKSTSIDKPRYHSVDIQETDDGFIISSYNPEIKKVAKTREEMLTAIQEILDTSTKKED